ncbi:MAG: hypothetical protein ACXAC7_09090 [Candidatus Hodarchaeales archaeon]|jgi:hypothetical protein
MAAICPICRQVTAIPEKSEHSVQFEKAAQNGLTPIKKDKTQIVYQDRFNISLLVPDFSKLRNHFTGVITQNKEKLTDITKDSHGTVGVIYIIVILALIQGFQAFLVKRNVIIETLLIFFFYFYFARILAFLFYRIGRNKDENIKSNEIFRIFGFFYLYLIPINIIIIALTYNNVLVDSIFLVTIFGFLLVLIMFSLSITKVYNISISSSFLLTLVITPFIIFGIWCSIIALYLFPT